MSVDEEQLDLTNDCLSTAENPQSLGNMENAKESNESMGTTRVFPSRGKWMPGLKPGDIHKSGCSVEYDCKPCNRRLTGRVVYEKHLQSELHFKRVAQSQSKSLESPPQLHQVIQTLEFIKHAISENDSGNSNSVIIRFHSRS